MYVRVDLRSNVKNIKQNDVVYSSTETFLSSPAAHTCKHTQSAANSTGDGSQAIEIPGEPTPPPRKGRKKRRFSLDAAMSSIGGMFKKGKSKEVCVCVCVCARMCGCVYGCVGVCRDSKCVNCAGEP